MKNIDHLLEKYWEGTSSLKEEQSLFQYFLNNPDHEDAAFFLTLKEEQNVVSSLTQDKFLAALASEKTAKVRKLQLKPLLKYAAILILPFALFFSINIFKMTETADSLAYNATDQKVEKQRVVEDPQEAYKLTMEALMFASKKLNKAEMEVKNNMPLLNKTRIIK